MNRAPLVSIGVPVYNGERYLAEALESALRQDYANLEVLIADNASTDSTAAICRRFENDARLRYVRNPETFDAVANFMRVLSLARGKYFTWLAHDDILKSPKYVSTLVQVLEANPDAILCASALELFNEDDPASRSILSYSWLTAAGDWRLARQALFRWPPGEWETLVYAIFLRERLQHHVAENPSFQFPLQRLAFQGRFVVVPPALRAYRLHDDSLARRRAARSPFELFLKGLGFKWRLLTTAASGPAPMANRLRLVLVALRNFFRDHVAWAYGVGRQTRILEAELRMLAATAAEREALVLRQDAELRRPGSSSRAVAIQVSRRRPSLNPFRRPTPEDATHLRDLTRQVADARQICQELLNAIDARERDLALHRAGR